jgi:pimeloyl-ACP methyl ester carboxylesterase
LLEPDDAITVWYADCDPADAAWAVSKLRPQGRRPIVEASPLDRWPDAPTTVILGRDERCVNMAWAVSAATARTDGTPPRLIDGGHSPFLSRPAELAAMLDAVAAE